MFLKKSTPLLLALAALAGCQSNELTEDPVAREIVIYPDAGDVITVPPAYETTPVPSLDDAADDPAIWVHPTDSAKSLVLGTDKKSGIVVYNLKGEQQQFLPMGLPNNIDLRQGVSIDGWEGDLAVASNREGDVVTLMSVTASGVKRLADFPSSVAEPYGICMGKVDNKVVVFVTHKDGQVVAYDVQQMGMGKATAPVAGTLKLATQLEGCVVDDAGSEIFIGEEETGLWRTKLSWRSGKLAFTELMAIDQVSSETGITPDVEGVSRYVNGTRDYLVASSQGNDSYAVYETNTGKFMGRFRIAASGSMDGTQETDGLDVSGAALGPDFPKGLLVVQDGYNAPAGTAQNFKLVDWRVIEQALNL